MPDSEAKPMSEGELRDDGALKDNIEKPILPPGYRIPKQGNGVMGRADSMERLHVLQGIGGTFGGVTAMQDIGDAPGANRNKQPIGETTVTAPKTQLMAQKLVHGTPNRVDDKTGPYCSLIMEAAATHAGAKPSEIHWKQMTMPVQSTCIQIFATRNVNEGIHFLKDGNVMRSYQM
uniref:Uncharacterized protein n=1 Tax=Romanomermis culicivorax TaxID=13658 RepID=A0A915KJT5_ROMCU